MSCVPDRAKIRCKGPREGEPPGVALRTIALVAALLGFAALVGHLVLGSVGVVAALGGAALLAVVGARIPAALAMRLHGAVPLASWQAPELHRMVEGLARRAGVVVPRLYLIPSLEANALAAGRGCGDAALAVTEGLVDLLDPDELEGVLAHEVAHLRNGDIALRHLAGTVAQLVISLIQLATWLSLFVLLLGGAGAFGKLLQLAALSLVAPALISMLVAAISRAREIGADATAARLTGDPLALASALLKLERQHRSWLGLLLGRPPAPPMLRSHPPTAERVERLEAIAGRRRPGMLPAQLSGWSSPGLGRRW